jgi:ribosomal protein L11 methyltransferase
MCLNWLDAQQMTGKTVIDYGCGSGILSIAAALLGAEKVWATDIDPQALIATNDNAEKNQVTEKIEAMLPQEFPEIQADVMMANILAGPLTELAPLFARLTTPNGLLVLSGVIESQKDEIIKAYQNDFEIELYQQQEEWICLSGTRKG